MVEGCLPWVGVRVEEGDRQEEEVGEVEEASYRREEGAGEVGTCLQMQAWVEEAEGHQGGRG